MTNYFNKNFSENLQAILARKGIKQGELAEKAGVNQDQISRWLNKKISISAKNIRKIAAALEVSVADLTRDPDLPPNDILAQREKPATDLDVLKMVKFGVRELLEEDKEGLQKLIRAAVRAECGIGDILCPLKKGTIQSAPVSGSRNDPYASMPGIVCESTELQIEIPKSPVDLNDEQRKWWAINAGTLRRWAETEKAAATFPLGVPAWVIKKYCIKVRAAYHGGSLDTVTGILWDFIQEGLR